MILGEGILFKKVIWQPIVTGNKNSNVHPKTWAIGKKDTIVSPGSRGILSLAKITFADKLL